MTGIIVFVCGLLFLILGYLVYGRMAERIYGVDARMVMPCVQMPDGVDYVPLPMWKVFLIQLLNIAGLGPVVGAISGCLFGPVALLWIVIGCVFAGAIHDFLAAAMSAERKGANLPELVGENLGEVARHAMRYVCIFLLLMVGVVFTLLPAGMMSNMFGVMPVTGWALVILLYYFLATILPISTIIGRIYPLFGAVFLFMAVGLLVMLPLSGYEVLPSLNFVENVHPKGVSLWPMLFVTIACGAISGFHATQSPMMVRCLVKAADIRRVFYGAMVVEGMVALIWAVVGLTLREVVVSGSSTMAEMTLTNPSAAVHAACNALLGEHCGMITVLGVVVLAITSGDTALRSCRLMVADVVRLSQKGMVQRLAVAVPLFLIVMVISQCDFSVIWRYFGWGNQMLACFTLWSIAACLRRRGKYCLFVIIPAVFMTCMCTCFLFYAPECGIGLSLNLSTSLGLLVAAICWGAFARFVAPASQKASA